MCPGRRGFRLTRAKEWGVVWKTYRWISAYRCWRGIGDGRRAGCTCEVTVKGPNLMGGMLESAVGGCCPVIWYIGLGSSWQDEFPMVSVGEVEGRRSGGTLPSSADVQLEV